MRLNMEFSSLALNLFTRRCFIKILFHSDIHIIILNCICLLEEFCLDIRNIIFEVKTVVKGELASATTLSSEIQSPQGKFNPLKLSHTNLSTKLNIEIKIDIMAKAITGSKLW